MWVVEDNDDYRSTLQELIGTETDLECAHAFASAEELFQELGSRFPAEPPSVLLLDIGLPGMDGIEAVNRMRSVARDVAIVMLTVHEDNDRIFRALCAGASGYLSKTASGSEILEAIWDVKRGGASMSPQIARRVLNIFTQLQSPTQDYGLTEREVEVLQQLVAARSKKRIARDLNLSIHTVDTHVRNIYTKLHVNTQAGAVAKALSERLIR